MTTPVAPDRRRAALLDRVFVACFCLFAFTSLVMEPYIVFRVDLARATDPFGFAWYWYARRFDPLFLHPPTLLRIMLGVDEFAFGPMYLLLIVGFLRRAAWLRAPALFFSGALFYSTVVYFLEEFLTQRGVANLFAVVAVNAPYLIVACLLAYRMRLQPAFSSGVGTSLARRQTERPFRSRKGL